MPDTLIDRTDDPQQKRILPIIGAQPASQFGSPVIQSLPSAGAQPQPAGNTTLSRVPTPLYDKYQNIANSPAPLSQIHNKPLRVLAGVGDVLSSLVPGIGRAIPGTTANRQFTLAQAKGPAEEEQKQQAEQARSGLESAQAGAIPSEIDLRGAQARHANAQADALEHPVAEKGGTVHEDAEGNYWVIHQDGSATQVAPKGQPLKAKTAEEKGGTVHEDAEGNMWVVNGKGEATPVVPKGGVPPAPPAPGATPAAAPVGATPAVGPGAVTPAQTPGQLKGKAKEKSETGAEDDQKYESLFAKKQLGQKLTPDEEAQMKAYEKRKTLNAQVTNVYAEGRENRKEQRQDARDLSKRLNDEFSAARTQLESLNEARQLINSGAVGQSLGTIKTIVGVAGGRGSGVRITQAELNSMASKLGLGDSMENWLSSVQGKGRYGPDTVRQINGVLSTIENTARAKEQNLRGALDALDEPGVDIKKVERDYRNSVAPSANQAGQPKVGDTKQFPNGKTGRWDGHGWVAQ